MYTEHHMAGNVYRREYLSGLEKLIQLKQGEAEQERRCFSELLLEEPDVYRKKLRDILGWPLNAEKDKTLPKAKRILLAKDGEISIYRMQIDVLGVPFYGILFVREDGKCRPFVISQHGALGFPELNSDLLQGGSSNYNSMTKRILQYDVNVFAPQLFLWTKPQHVLSEEEDIVFDDTYESTRRRLDESLKQLGGSMAAFEIYCLTRVLDYFEVQDYVDKTRMGMIGMSSGGFYTLYTAAVETRLKANLACSFYNNRIKYTNYDWAIRNAAHTFTDNEIVLMIYPRMLYIAVGRQDLLFGAQDAENEYEKLKEMLPDDHKVMFEVFDGDHEFVPTDHALNAFMKEL